MIAVALLARLNKLAVSVRADGDNLRLHPASAIPEALLVELRQHKPKLLAALATPVGQLDLGKLPWGPCPACSCGLWWRASSCGPNEPREWACEGCDPPPSDVWRDACAVPRGSGR